MNSNLTISFPTYNRKSSIIARINEIKDKAKNIGVNILIIDNNSEDGTFDSLISLFNNEKHITILKNSFNIGFARNFFRLFRECQTDYILISSDEDEVKIEAIEKYLIFLNKNQPYFVSPQAIINKKVYRGRSKINTIKEKDFILSSFYSSGITFKINKKTIQAIDKLEKLLETNSVSVIYPQTLLSLIMILEGKCYWYPNVITIARDKCEGYIRDSSGERYQSPGSRYKQTLGYVEFLETLKENYPNKLNIIEKLKIERQKSIFYQMRWAIEYSNPELLPYFDKGAKEFRSINFYLRKFLASEKSPLKKLINTFF